MATFNDPISLFNDSITIFNSGDPSILDAPILLSAIVIDGKIQLNWSEVVSATGYKVKYGTASGEYTTITDAGNILTYTFTGLTVNTVYYFVVSSYDDAEESLNSNELNQYIFFVAPPVFDLDTLLDYYAKLLIIQYRTLPKAEATIKCLVDNSMCDGLPLQLKACFDLDTAVGSQLTILGIIVGVPRNVYGLDLEHTFFQFTRYSGSPTGVGFGLYSDSPYPISLFRRYQNNATYTLTDFELRSLIRLKIIYNNTFSSLKNIVDGLWDIFGSEVQVVDNRNMTITFNVDSVYTNAMLAAEYLGILPKPMGVSATVNLV